MRRITFLKAALCLIALMLVGNFTVGSSTATAQCAICPDWWVSYEYIWPPCDPLNAVTVDVDWANGLTSNVSSSVDGHIIYPTPQPFSPAVGVRVNGVKMVIGGPKVNIPYNCGNGMINMCLEVEVRCNPCLEVKVKLVPGPC
jgi:hypothetical protein